jgi:hypothetical protein
MKISELIKQAELAYSEHGDIPVGHYSDYIERYYETQIDDLNVFNALDVKDSVESLGEKFFGIGL